MTNREDLIKCLESVKDEIDGLPCGFEDASDNIDYVIHELEKECDDGK